VLDSLAVIFNKFDEFRLITVQLLDAKRTGIIKRAINLKKDVLFFQK
jgi:hypothetical protein